MKSKKKKIKSSKNSIDIYIKIFIRKTSRNETNKTNTKLKIMKYNQNGKTC